MGGLECQEITRVMGITRLFSVDKALWQTLAYYLSIILKDNLTGVISEKFASNQGCKGALYGPSGEML